MSSPTVRRNIPCIGCGYDLEGLPARGTCPECGRAIVDSLAERLDLPLEAVPRPPASLRLSWALLLAALGAFLGSGVLATIVFSLLRLRPDAPAAAETAVEILSAGPRLAFVGTAVAAIALLVLPPSDSSRPSRWARRIGAPAFAAWSVGAWMQPSLGWLLVVGLAAAVALAGLSPAYAELAPRSKVYRSHRTAAQRIGALNLAVLGATACAALELSIGAIPWSSGGVVRALGEVRMLLALTGSACAAASVLGLGYLFVNSLWILQALRRPAPTSTEVLGGRD